MKFGGGGAAGEETTLSNSHIAQKAIKFDDLDLARRYIILVCLSIWLIDVNMFDLVDPLRDEFKSNLDKIKDDKRNKEF